MYYIITEIGEIVRRKQPLPPLSHSERFTTSAPATPEHCHRPPSCALKHANTSSWDEGCYLLALTVSPSSHAVILSCCAPPAGARWCWGVGGQQEQLPYTYCMLRSGSGGYGRRGGVRSRVGGWGGRVTALLGEGDPGRISTGLDDSRRWVCVTPQCVLEW